MEMAKSMMLVFIKRTLLMGLCGAWPLSFKVFFQRVWEVYPGLSTLSPTPGQERSQCWRGGSIGGRVLSL